MNRTNMTITAILIVIVGIGLVVYKLSVNEPAQVVIDENATFSGNIVVEKGTRYHSMRVYENATGIHFILNCGWNDFDLYGRLDTQPSQSYYHFRSINSGGEDYYYSDPEPGIWNLMIYAYSGAGHYDLIIEIDYE